MKRKSSLLSLLFTLGLVAGTVLLWYFRQDIVDAVNYNQFEPSAAIQEITAQAGMTDDATYTFYASRPLVQTSAAFNKNCTRKEANSPILGCYSVNRIYIFDVTDPRLDGLKTVTAAHEMLHAEYERLSADEKQHLDSLLEAAYVRVENDELKERMAYYQKTEPGQRSNELHSILGTETADLGPELEAYYSKYFKSRPTLVTLHNNVNAVFTSLESEGKQLAARIDGLVNQINSQTRQYNSDAEALNDDVDAFNRRARLQGGFQSQSDFEAERSRLSRRSNSLSVLRNQIEQNVVLYKSLFARLGAINAESSALTKSIDSTLNEVPQVQ